MLKFREISNFLFFVFVLLLFCFAVFNFYFGFSWQSVILSILLTILISLITMLIFKKINQKTSLTKQEKKEKETALTSLLIMPKQKQTLLFKKAASAAVLNFFSTKAFDDDSLYKAIAELNELDETAGTIFCQTINPQTLFKVNSIENYKLGVITYDDLFLKLKEKNQIPQKTILYKNKTKLNFKQFFYLLFNPKHIKSYCFFGFLMLFSSFIVPFTLYYKIFACIFFGLAIICCFNRVKITPPIQN